MRDEADLTLPRARAAYPRELTQANLPRELGHQTHGLSNTRYTRVQGLPDDPARTCSRVCPRAERVLIARGSLEGGVALTRRRQICHGNWGIKYMGHQIPDSSSCSFSRMRRGC